ncbi:unnamed protein product [Owenia fusiformis]|uniref:Protein-glucosylgalactosylhydroxylysine glucosidase n=1 Tax=Owenia fusiformis TaxID=6347 RepID=A0A8S4PH18_OWEFU|nr:unnamed protein product [Owenia fusiformis]
MKLLKLRLRPLRVIYIVLFLILLIIIGYWITPNRRNHTGDFALFMGDGKGSRKEGYGTHDDRESMDDFGHRQQIQENAGKNNPSQPKQTAKDRQKERQLMKERAEIQQKQHLAAEKLRQHKLREIERRKAPRTTLSPEAKHDKIVDDINKEKDDALSGKIGVEKHLIDNTGDHNIHHVYEGQKKEKHESNTINEDDEENPPINDDNNSNDEESPHNDKNNGSNDEETPLDNRNNDSNDEESPANDGGIDSNKRENAPNVGTKTQSVGKKIQNVEQKRSNNGEQISNRGGKPHDPNHSKLVAKISKVSEWTVKNPHPIVDNLQQKWEEHQKQTSGNRQVASKVKDGIIRDQNPSSPQKVKKETLISHKAQKDSVQHEKQLQQNVDLIKNKVQPVGNTGKTINSEIHQEQVRQLQKSKSRPFPKDQVNIQKEKISVDNNLNTVDGKVQNNVKFENNDMHKEQDPNGSVVKQPGNVVKQPGSVIKQSANVVKQPGSKVKQSAGVVNQPGGVVKQPNNVNKPVQTLNSHLNQHLPDNTDKHVKLESSGKKPIINEPKDGQIKTQFKEEHEEIGVQKRNTLVLMHNGSPVTFPDNYYAQNIHDITEHWMDKDTYIFSTKQLPIQNYMPSVGNGHVAAVVNGKYMFMNGVYNGAGSRSHRAQIPAYCACNVTSIEPIAPGLTRTYTLNVLQGIFLQEMSNNLYKVTHRIYAHRNISQLMVVEIEVEKFDPDIEVKVNIELTRGQGHSQDINFGESPAKIKGVRYRHGEIYTPETVDSKRTQVHVYFDAIPRVLNVPKALNYVKYVYLMSSSVTKLDAMEGYQLGRSMLQDADKLYVDHINTWAKLWSRGRIDVEGNVPLAQTIYASMYYTLSSIPVRQNPVQPFWGLAPSGLAHGDKDVDYNGHIFWDQETWMFPPINLLHRELAPLILETRTRMLKQARLNAQQNGYKGAQYPWESAFTGVEVSPSKNCSKYEVHINADIALAIKHYLYLTRDQEYVVGEGGDVIIALAEFWVSRLFHNMTEKRNEIRGVMPPDEYHFPVNNSAYTNYAAKLALELPDLAYRMIQQRLNTASGYSRLASEMYIPFDIEKQYHPEFDGYVEGTEVKQADVVMLGYPLNMDMPESVRKNDLNIYRKVTDMSGPCMTWSMFAINWLDIGDTENADKMFKWGYTNAHRPFMVWKEKVVGEGAKNFQTGMGGFLQSLLYGYGGFRILEDRLQFNFVMPPATKLFVLTGVDYLGCSFDFTADYQFVHVTMTTCSDIAPPMAVYSYTDKMQLKLTPKSPMKLNRVKNALMPIKKENTG